MDQYFQPISDSVTAVKAKTDEPYDYSLMITGITGSGKSSLCGFLCCNKEAFKSKGGFASITSKSAAAAVTLQDKRIRLIDTPGFCDDYETEEQHMDEIGEAMFLARKGVHAVGLAIGAGNRYTKSNNAVVKELSQISNKLWPFTFIVFTNADSLGNTEEEREAALQKNLSDARCPPALFQLVQSIKYRYILVDSTDKTADYHRLKVQQLMEMIKRIHTENNHKLYTNELFNKARELQEKILEEKEAIKKKKKMADFKAKFEAEAKLQQEKVAEEARITEKLAKQKQENLQKRLEGEEQAMLKERENQIAKIEEQKQKLAEENKKIQEDIERLQLETPEIQEDEHHELEVQAGEEALEELKKELRQIRKLNEDLQKKKSKKWYSTLAKKTTGKECTIQ